MRERGKGRTLVARDEGDDAYGVVIKLYGEEVVKATPGCWVLKPRRIPHTMWNAGPEPARIIEVYTPGGFELFFDDWVPDLKATYNLRLIGE